MVSGWKERASLASQGFSNLGAFYIRFDAPLELPAATEGLPDDPVVLVDMDTGELFPLDIQFFERPLDDPFVARNMLAAAPRLGASPDSGARLAAVVMRRAGVRAPAGYTLPAGVQEALELAGVAGRAAVATTWTTADGIDQMQQLFASADSWVDAQANWVPADWRRVDEIRVSQGLTPSGEEATVYETLFADGGTGVAYLSSLDGPDGTHSHALADWPVAVFESTISVPYYSGLADRPFMSPGLAHLNDTDIFTGWIDFSGGALQTQPETDTVRLVLQVPVDAAGEPRPIEGLYLIHI